MLDVPPPSPPHAPNVGVLIDPKAAPWFVALFVFLFVEIVFIGRYDNGFWLGLLPAFFIAGLSALLVRRLAWLSVAIALLASLFAFLG